METVGEGKLGKADWKRASLWDRRLDLLWLSQRREWGPKYLP